MINALLISASILIFSFAVFGQTPVCDEKDFDCRIAAADKSIRANPNDEDGYIVRANAYDESGQFEKALGDYNKALELNPKSVLGYLNRGLAYYAHGDVNPAIADYTKVIELDPTNARAYHDRANAYDDSGKFELAINDYNKSVELKPNYVLAYLNRAIAYYKKGDFTAAIRDLTKVISLDSDNQTAYQGRASIYEKIGEQSKAAADRRKLAELSGDISIASVLLRDTTESGYKVGQMWSYKTRADEKDSYFIVLKIEHNREMGNIVHLFLGGLKMKCRNSPQCLTDKANHLPFAESAVDKSAVKLLRENVILPDYKKGYNLWREAFEAKSAGVYTIGIAEAVDVMEKSLNQ